MSTESLQGMIMTATVGIFSPDMKEVIVFVNNKLWGIVPEKRWGIVPVGGKFDPERDRDIYATAVRESKEESWVALLSGSGVFLDKAGTPVLETKIIQYENFTLPDGRPALDSLFFFRLHSKPAHDLKVGAYWIGKKEYEQENMKIGDRTYPFLIPSVRRAILNIMEYGNA